MITQKNVGEPDGEINVWSNTIDYLRKLAVLEDQLQYAYLQRKTRQAINIIDTMLIMLKRTMSSDAEEYETIRKKITEASTQVAKAEQYQKGKSDAAKKLFSKHNAKALEIIREAWEDIGAYMYDKGMTFQKGMDPNRAWAEG